MQGSLASVCFLEEGDERRRQDFCDSVIKPDVRLHLLFLRMAKQFALSHVSSPRSPFNSVFSF